MSDSGRDSDADGQVPSGLGKTLKRVSKPQMEKRRRERINSSLEALRLLMVEGTDNEKLKNPKVEKAEILESVVRFLKAERGQQAAGRALPAEPPPGAAAQQQSYQSGMRSCVLRVNHFMRQGAAEAPGTHGNPLPFGFPGPPPPIIRGPLMAASSGMGAALGPQLLPHQLPPPYLGRIHYSPREMLPRPALPVQVTEAVWRPWPK